MHKGIKFSEKKKKQSDFVESFEMCIFQNFGLCFF